MIAYMNLVFLESSVKNCIVGMLLTSPIVIMVIIPYSCWLVQHRSFLHHRLLLCLRGAGTLKTFKEYKKLFILNRVIQLLCRVIVEWGLGAEQGFVLLVGKVRMRTNSKISASLV